MFAAPTIVKRLVDEAQRQGWDAARCQRSFKTIVYGGAPMYAADIQRALQVMGPRFVQIYGQGETPMVGTCLSRQQLQQTDHPRYLHRLASIGVAQTPVRVRIAGPDGQDVPLGEVGEVIVRGDTVMAGYWRNPEATAATIRDGWLWTGDMGSMDADGFVTLKDRSKDLIISGGSNIYPREVEEVLLTHPAVAEVAVLGVPDRHWGEVGVAVVVRRPGAEPVDGGALIAWLDGRLARGQRLAVDLDAHRPHRRRKLQQAWRRSAIGQDEPDARAWQRVGLERPLNPRQNQGGLLASASRRGFLLGGRELAHGLVHDLLKLALVIRGVRHLHQVYQL